MAESPNLVAERLTRAEGYDYRPVWLMSDAAARDNLQGYEGQRAWLQDGTKFKYTAGSWTSTTDDFLKPYPDAFVGDIDRNQFNTDFRGARDVNADYNQTIFPLSPLHAPFSAAFDGWGGGLDINRGSVYVVENLNASGAGSLFAAPADSYVIFPYLSGAILPTARINSTTDDQTILGQTSQGSIEIHGSSQPVDSILVNEQGSRKLWQHIAFRASETTGSNTSGTSFDLYDGGGSPVTDVVMSHCSFAFGDDNVASTWYDTSRVSWLDCLFTMGTDNRPGGPGTGTGNANYSHLVGGGAHSQTVARCLLMGRDRNPVWQNTYNGDLTNNIVYSQGTGSSWQSNNSSGFPGTNPFTQMTGNCTDNLFIRVNGSTGQVADIAFQERDPGTHTLRVYVDRNYHMTRGQQASTATAANLVQYGGGPAPFNDIVVNTRFTDNPDFAKLDARTALYDHVMNKVGASHNRSALDQTAIDAVTSGQVLVEHGTAAGYGGYPAINLPAVAKPDIWDLAAVDKISDATKTACGIAAGTDTIQSNHNGGSSSDFLWILQHAGYPING